MRRSEQHAPARMRAEIGKNFEIQCGGTGPMVELEDGRRIRRDHAAELEPVHGAKLDRQVETLLPKADLPVQLHDTGKNRLAGKVAVEIKQIARADQFEDRV